MLLHEVLQLRGANAPWNDPRGPRNRISGGRSRRRSQLTLKQLMHLLETGGQLKPGVWRGNGAVLTGDAPVSAVVVVHPLLDGGGVGLLGADAVTSRPAQKFGVV